MSLTIRDARSSYLHGRAEAEEWRAEFIQQWAQPEIDAALVMFWQRLDPVTREMLRQMNPEAYAQAEQAVQNAKARGESYGLRE